jgi:hypothetical protein
MSQHISDPSLLGLIADAAKQSPFTDGATLHFEQSNEDLLLILRMPETHLDLAQLKQLLMLCGQRWPVALAASLAAEDAQALLFARLDISTLDADSLTQAMATLQHARKRWLQAPPVHVPPRARAGASL